MCDYVVCLSLVCQYCVFLFFFFKQKTAYEMRISDWSSDVCSSDLAERNDMVEYFGEQLAGFAFSHNGWVQSYGSRCVKPPIIYGDVSRPYPKIGRASCRERVCQYV